MAYSGPQKVHPSLRSSSIIAGSFFTVSLILSAIWAVPGHSKATDAGRVDVKGTPKNFKDLLDVASVASTRLV